MRLVLAFAVLACFGCGRTIDTTISDAGVTAGVKTALLNDTRIDGTAIQVRTAAGVVYLSGAVASSEDLAYVVGLVRSVDGVRAVESSLEVDAVAVNPTPRP